MRFLGDASDDLGAQVASAQAELASVRSQRSAVQAQIAVLSRVPLNMPLPAAKPAAVAASSPASASPAVLDPQPSSSSSGLKKVGAVVFLAWVAQSWLRERRLLRKGR